MASPRFSTYDPSQVSIVFSGVLMDGLGEDTFLTLSRNAESFTTTVGVDGKVTRNKILDESGTFTITLQSSSNVNDQLSAIYNLDRLTPGGAGVGPLTIRDNSGRTLLHCPEAWIQAPPELEFSQEAGDVEWTIAFSKIEFFAGGR